MMSLSADKSADIIDVFNIKFRYLDDSMNINDIYFDTKDKSNLPFRTPTE